MNPSESSPLIYGFDEPHPVGVICRQPCKYCGETSDNLGIMSGPVDGECIEPIPMLILREASKQEYIDQVVRVTGKLPSTPIGPYFYAVSVD